MLWSDGQTVASCMDCALSCVDYRVACVCTHIHTAECVFMWAGQPGILMYMYMCSATIGAPLSHSYVLSPTVQCTLLFLSRMERGSGKPHPLCSLL